LAEPHAFQGPLRSWSIGASSGFLAGLVAGIASRVAMRASGSLTEGAARGIKTDNGETVGLITFGGSITLILFVALVGVAGGLLYMLLRPSLPSLEGARARHYALFTLLCFGLLGIAVVDAENFDFRTFGPAAVNLAMYSLLGPLFALVLIPIVRWADGWAPRPPVSNGILALAAVPVVLSLPALLVLVGAPGFLGLIGGGVVWLLVLIHVYRALAPEAHRSRLQTIVPGVVVAAAGLGLGLWAFEAFHILE